MIRGQYKRAFSAWMALPTRTIVILVAATWCGSSAGNCAAADSSSPPALPAKFDEATVWNLLDHIDQGQNATILEFGYFLQRVTAPFPAKSGLTLIRDAIAKEPAGTHKWYLLESVRGLAGINLSPETHLEGFASYDDLFEKGKDAPSKEDGRLLQRAITDFIFCLRNGLSPTVPLSGPPGSPLPSSFLLRQRAVASRVLMSAIHLHFFLLKTVGKPDIEPPWSRAVLAMDKSVNFPEIVAGEMEDPQFAHSYTALRSAAALDEVDDLPASVQFLMRAKQLLPDVDSAERDWLYRHLEDDLVESGHSVQAIEVARDFVEKSSRGRSALLSLTYRLGSGAQFASAVAKASDTFVDETDLKASIDYLLAQSMPAPDLSRPSDDAVKILESYLTSIRKRDSSAEIEFRLILARLYLDRGERDEAIDAISPDHFATVKPDAATAESLREAAQLYRQLTAGNN